MVSLDRLHERKQNWVVRSVPLYSYDILIYIMFITTFKKEWSNCDKCEGFKEFYKSR